MPFVLGQSRRFHRDFPRLHGDWPHSSNIASKAVELLDFQARIPFVDERAGGHLYGPFQLAIHDEDTTLRSRAASPNNLRLTNDFRGVKTDYALFSNVFGAP